MLGSPSVSELLNGYLKNQQGQNTSNNQGASSSDGNNNANNGGRGVNVFEALQDFWTNKKKDDSNPSAATIIYESVHSQSPPYVCFVTLPGGACFGSWKSCPTKAEARKSAAKIALMNSLYNEQPNRKISDDFINVAINDAQSYIQGSFQSQHGFKHSKEEDELGLKIYQEMLQMSKGKSMLEFQEMMTMFQLLHWNGTLKAMRERNCTKKEVLSYYTTKQIDDSMRTQMALDWVAREKLQNTSGSPQAGVGVILPELQRCEDEIEQLRNLGRELRFPKEKREILLLAQNQTKYLATTTC